MAKLGWKYYILFCIIDALFIVQVWFLFPETKGESLEDHAGIFDRLDKHALVDVETSKLANEDDTDMEKKKKILHEEKFL